VQDTSFFPDQAPCDNVYLRSRTAGQATALTSVTTYLIATAA
jgi:hypothetical protein